jgi:hypothetical protein
MNYFGPPWDAPVCDEGEQVETPQGEPCGRCGVAIHYGDRGLLLVYYGDGGPTDWPVHLDCLLTAVTGKPQR